MGNCDRSRVFRTLALRLRQYAPVRVGLQLLQQYRQDRGVCRQPSDHGEGGVIRNRYTVPALHKAETFDHLTLQRETVGRTVDHVGEIEEMTTDERSHSFYL